MGLGCFFSPEMMTVVGNHADGGTTSSRDRARVRVRVEVRVRVRVRV